MSLVCGRTPQIRDWIVNAVANVTECSNVTETNLNGITSAMVVHTAGMTELRSGDFDGLTKVEVVNLGGNELTTIPGGIFDEMTKLRDLKLNGNQLRTLPADMIKNNKALRNFGIDGNQLQTLPNGMFAGLSSLYDLDARNNPWKELKSGTFTGASLAIVGLSNGDFTAVPTKL